ncbi:hypothetical protein ACTXT7_017208 [Hymenolepis weldensis]
MAMRGGEYIHQYVGIGKRVANVALVSKSARSKRSNSVAYHLLAAAKFDSDSCFKVYNLVDDYDKFRSLTEASHLVQDREPPVFNLKGHENDQSSLHHRDPLPNKKASNMCQKQPLPRCPFCGECQYHRDCFLRVRSR